MTSWSEHARLGENVGRIFAELNEHIIAYQPRNDRWFVFPTPTAAKDWAECLFCISATSLVAESTPPILFLLLESTCDEGKPRSSLTLLEFIRYLRLSKYHPRAWGATYSLWCSPIVCYSFESRERILQRRPEGLVLFSPSLSFQQLPILASPSWLDAAHNLRTATDGELTQYLNSTHPVNLSAHHYLGDLIGPYSILHAAGTVHSPDTVSPGRFNVKVLHEIFWQMEQERSSGEERAPKVSTNTMGDLRQEVQTYVASSMRGRSKSAVLIIDDQSDLWHPVWKFILGGGWQRFHPEKMFELMAPQSGDAARAEFFKTLQLFIRLIILDLRLTPEQDHNKDLHGISGYRVLRFIRTYDQAIPILMFTSSQRGHYLHDLELAGADAVCIKPTRFDNASTTLESLLEHLSVLLRPEYHFLQDSYYDLREQQAQLKPHEEKWSPLYWALSAWQEARQNARLWIKQAETNPARLSALSVARTAGLAEEIIHEKFGAAAQPYGHAMRELRNVASHFGSAQASDTAIGYVAVGLVTKMLSVLDSSLIPTLTNRARINIPNDIYLESHLSVPGMEPTLLKMFQGTVQVALLAFSLRQNAAALGLNTSLVDYVFTLEEKANQWIGEFLSKHNISKQILSPIATDYSGLLRWFNSL
jgi:CheY-like chemotaxis protein